MVKNKFKKIKIGVEVECIINTDIINFIGVGSYHNGVTLKDSEDNKINTWKVETDSSINYGQKFKKGRGLEFVSKTFKSKKDFFRGIDDFIKVFSVNGKYELKEVMEINESCGCHIHISKDNKLFAKKVHSYFYENAKNDFMKMLKKSNLSENVKNGVRKQYYRDFAQKSDKIQFDNNRSDFHCIRNSEWNFKSEKKGYGLEWRSFNLRNVETWKDFKYLMSLGFTTLEPLILSLNSWKKGNMYSKPLVNVGEIKKDVEIKIKKHTYKSRKISIPKRKSINRIILRKNSENIFIKMKNKEIKTRESIKEMLSNAIRGGGEHLQS